MKPSFQDEKKNYCKKKLKKKRKRDVENDN